MKRQIKDNEYATSREAIRMAQIDFSSLRPTLIELVMAMMKEAFERVKISLILPKLIQDRAMVKNVLTGTQYEPAIKLIDDFLRRRDIILRERRQPLMDHGMIQIIDYFQRNMQIYTLFPGLVNAMSKRESALLMTFAKLLKVAETHLKRDAYEQIAHERHLHKVLKEKQKLWEEIQKFQNVIEKHRIEESASALAKEQYVAKLMEERRQKKLRDDMKIEHEIEVSRRAMRANAKASRDKQIELADELEKVRYEDAKLTKDSKKAEKEAREEKNKFEIQLQSIIKKYDTMMIEKFVENLELTDKLNEAQKKLDEFKLHYRKEQRIYNEIVVKREKEEERRKQEMIFRYMMNRAARKIQKYWRAWRKSLRKKNKRAKKPSTSAIDVNN
ncbi:PREDICTED: trichohyalin [Drosophila arizonae]|uniref:Dynein regulatory complex protein 10 n=1 Tax=Drosophila arizonae TaxID=7263 RepID=A0ABM1NN39_DROAR|nr:PREDICTED: trichohyalin [Drosophila arizonae]